MIYLPGIIILIFCGVQGVNSMKNGRRAANMEFPFVVSIQHHLLHLCSGTIIDDHHILTVAHAVLPLPASGLLVVPGTFMVKWPYRAALTVKNIYPHPHYRELTVVLSGQSDLYWANDIAILRLNEPLSLDFFIGPVSLTNTNFEAYRCFDCIMISWNYPDENNLEMVVLMWDIVYMVENSRCKQWGIRVLANQNCFIDFVETAFISTEDLGSPIICGGSMVGLIVKEARQGEATSPAILQSTLNYTEFISEIINGGEMHVQPGDFPYIVSIWHYNKHVCGGLIVNTNQVITAGKCIRSPSGIYPTKLFRIAAGSNVVSLFDSRARWYLVSHTEVHPSYQPNRYENDFRRYEEHDIGLITVSTPFLWSPTIQKLKLADADDFSINQLCQVFHWRDKGTGYGIKKYWKLTKTTAVLIGNGQSLVQLGRFHIAVKELFSAKPPQFTDIGSPIVCRGHPLGIMVGIHSINESLQNPQIIFLRLRPYAIGRNIS